MSVIERALELADTGKCHSVTDIQQALKSEGFIEVVGHLSGKAIRQQLRARMLSAKPA